MKKFNFDKIKDTSDKTINKGLHDFSDITQEWMYHARIEIANDTIKSLEENDIELTESLSNIINNFMN
tara:strand:+ start:10 stop:213 length:204 start_codon:yes stop_codon:yes gene_type:complete